MILENKYVHDYVEDERSTSAGSSDNEEAPLSPPPGLTCNNETCGSVQSQVLFRPPPGLEAFAAPPGLEVLSHACSQNFADKRVLTSGKRQPKQMPWNKRSPKQVPQTPVASCKDTLPAPKEFDQATYRKELADVLRGLSAGGNVVATSVQRIRIQNVPKERQAAEFADILARAAEDNRGVVRRLSFAFAVGLAVGVPKSAFDREECARGIEYFFLEVFDDLAAEVPRLRSKIANELVPTLRTVFTEEQLETLVPPDCRAVLC